MSDLARKRIAENRRTRDTFLDLGNCGLTEVPAEVGELVWLESLTLTGQWYEWDGRGWRLNESQNSGEENHRLTNIRPLGRLTRLRSIALASVADLAPVAELRGLQVLFVRDVVECDLAPLAELSALQVLFVAGTHVADLAPLAGLSALQVLYVMGPPVGNLAPLAGLSALRVLNVSDTDIADLAPLAGLCALNILDISNTPVVSLAPLAGLSALQVLDASRTEVADLTPLVGLTALQQLAIGDTQIADLAPLTGLSTLLELDVSRTQVADLAPLTGLSALKLLDVSHTQVSDLSALASLVEQGCPVRWSFKSWEGPGIYVEGCPLTSPPPEIVKQGNDAILNYFRERALGEVDHLYEAKMLIVGEGGAGKTSLLRRLYQPDRPLPAENETTRGIAIYRHEFLLRNGRRFRLNVWDFGGQEIYHATHQFFLTRRSLYLLVDDTRKDHKSVSDEGFKYWLELIDVFGGHSPVLIFQNEKGGRSKAIDIGGIKGRYDNVKELYGGNLEHGRAADRLRAGVEYFAGNLGHIGEELPARWIKVRAAIEDRARETPHITQQEYFEIYGRYMEFDRSRALHLSRYLHDLGVFLHFQDDPLLARTVILQNEWATEAVYRILDDEGVKARSGRFTGADCERLWLDSTYADMHPELLALMQRFEICYELRDSSPRAWLAPQLLPPARPAELAGWGKPEDLVLRYLYDFLPKGIVSRLTVRLHRFVCSPAKAWATGVLFERGATGVLVTLLPNGREIELRARGPEHKALLSVVAADLDSLNESFQGLRDRVDKRIPCNCRRCRAAAVPAFFAQKALLRRKEDNRLKVECPESYEDVDVPELLDGVRTDRLPGWANEGSYRTLRIFLASSCELRGDRDAFELYFRQQNDGLRKRGLYLEIVRWENFLDAISETRLQDEYNEAARGCDICVCLFFTKAGAFTGEEFDAALEQFKATGKPRIYTYFKNADIKISDMREEDILSLFAFKKKLANLGHFPTDYDAIEQLQLHFRGQLDKLLDEAGPGSGR